MPTMRVVVRGTAFGQQMAITRYFDVPTIPASFQTFANTFGGALETNWGPAAHDLCVLNDLYISQATTGSLGVAVTPSTFPVTGQQNSETALPPQNAVLAVYGGASLSYPRQNRNRLAGVVEEQVTGGVLNSTGVSDWTAVMNVLSGTMFDGVNNWVGVLWSDLTQASAPITSRTLRSQISTQDSRKVGAGA